MAKATSKTAITGVTLELTADEAYAVTAVLAHVSGDSKLSPARDAKSVLSALADFYKWPQNKPLDLVAEPKWSGIGIRFKNFTADKGNS